LSLDKNQQSLLYFALKQRELGLADALAMHDGAPTADALEAARADRSTALADHLEQWPVDGLQARWLLLEAAGADSEAAVGLLLDRGAQPVAIAGRMGPLELAASVGATPRMLQLLVRAGAEVDRLRRPSPLLLVVTKDGPDVFAGAKVLLDAGARAARPGGRGLTATPALRAVWKRCAPEDPALVEAMLAPLTQVVDLRPGAPACQAVLDAWLEKLFAKREADAAAARAGAGQPQTSTADAGCSCSAGTAWALLPLALFVRRPRR
jgi:hypothetical protein